MRTPMLIILSAFLLTAVGCDQSVDRQAEESALLALHERVLEAHRSGDVEDWMIMEADTILSANRGTISLSVASERREMRQGYLGSTDFSVYRDLRPPVVRVSEDGTLGWVVAEVEMKGVQVSDSGEKEPIEAIWAWIELYEKLDGEWKSTGNVSNRRP